MNVKWKVELSNKEQFMEGEIPFLYKSDELSPFSQLLQYLDKNNASISSLCLLCGDRQYRLPSKGKNPKFRAFRGSNPPQYNFFRQIGVESTGIRDLFAVAEAIYPNYKLQLWVDENNPNNCWALAIDTEVR